MLYYEREYPGEAAARRIDWEARRTALLREVERIDEQAARDAVSYPVREKYGRTIVKIA